MTSQARLRGDETPAVRVLWLIKGLGAGGAERLLEDAARLRDIQRFSCRVAYLLPWKDALVDRFHDVGVETICLEARGTLDPSWMWRLRALLRSAPADIVHVHSPIVATGTRLVVRTIPRRPRLVTTEHNVWSSHHRVTAFANAVTAPLDDARFAVSEAVRNSMPDRLRSSTGTIRYGIDVGAVAANAPDRTAIRDSLGFAPHEIVVGTVANLRRTKGYPDLLTAARRVLSEVHDVRFVVVGQGPLEQELRDLHAHLQLGDRFTFLGYRDDATRVMAGFDLFCMASHFEGLPISLMEATALGLPIVATEVGGIPEFVVDGEEAVLVPPARPDLLAEAIMTVVTDPERRRKMAHASLERANDADASHAVRAMESVYLEKARR